VFACGGPDGFDHEVGSESTPGSPRGAAARAPVHVRLNGLPDAVSTLFFVPPSGFVVHIEGLADEGARETVRVIEASGAVHDWSEAFTRNEGTGAWVVPERRALPEGTHTLQVDVRGPDGNQASDSLVFTVRRFSGGGPPIGEGQHVWLDFDADRDRAPGRDFDADLRAFGLVSVALTEEETERVRRRVIDRVLARVRSAYAEPLAEPRAEPCAGADPTGLHGPDPVRVGFSSEDPGAPDTTRICVGGADPTGGQHVGHVALDPGNARRSDVVCGPWPPGGVFPRALLTYAEQPAFRDAFDPLRPEAGGLPLGRHRLDAAVLARGLAADTPEAPPEHRARALAIRRGLEAFAHALGTVLAHETGHALGLVPIGPPGAGLYGGSEGEAFAHNTSSPGAHPDRPRLMDPGRRFTFADLAGVAGDAPISFGPLSHAYLRDRVVLTSEVEAPVGTR